MYLPIRHYTDVECPNGHVVERVLKNYVAMGDPERTCKKCGLQVHIPELCEWPDMTDTQRREHVRSVLIGGIFAGPFFGILIGVALMVVGLFANLPDSMSIPLFFVGFAAGFGVFAWRQVAKVRRSIARAAARAFPVQ